MRCVSEAELARDAGIALVSENNEEWLDRALKASRSSLAPGEEVTGEMIKLRLLAAGLPQPKSQNGWGALVRSMALRGWLTDLNRSTLATTKASHARRVMLWRVNA